MIRHHDLLDRQQRLEQEVEDAHLRIVLRDPSAEKDYRNLSSSREWECLPYAYQAHGKQYFHCISVVFEVANALAVLSW